MTTPRKSNGKRKYSMDYIEDKRLYAAVMWSRKMIREGVPPGVANVRSAKYCGYPVSDVAHYVGQAAGTTRGRVGYQEGW